MLCWVGAVRIPPTLTQGTGSSSQDGQRDSTGGVAPTGSTAEEVTLGNPTLDVEILRESYVTARKIQIRHQKNPFNG